MAIDAPRVPTCSAVPWATYRPDLFPTSYEFSVDGADVGVTVIDGKSLHLSVAYARAPTAEPVADLLPMFSGLPMWTERPTTDPPLAKHFHFSIQPETRSSR